MSDKKFKVLIVEDDEELLPMIADVLREEPEFQVECIDDGFKASLKILEWIPDVILLDYVIPGLNGFELCKKIREDEKTKHIPVLAISSLSSSDHKKAIMESGITDYLPKPFSSNALTEKVWQLLGKKDAAN